jgi:hypothetical protein
MSQAVIVEVAGNIAGILIKERNRFQFHASNASLKPIEGQTFQSLECAELAVDKVLTSKPAKSTHNKSTFLRSLF